jgi:hypothetical protein
MHARAAFKAWKMNLLVKFRLLRCLCFKQAPPIFYSFRNKQLIRTAAGFLPPAKPV